MTIVDRALITAADWQPKLGALGEIVAGIDDIEQCFAIILLTPKGAIPHRPDFGSNIHRFLGMPITEARPQLVREVVDAIAACEPRAEVLSVDIDKPVITGAQPGATLAVTIEWRPVDGGEEIVSLIAVGGAQ